MEMLKRGGKEGKLQSERQMKICWQEGGKKKRKKNTITFLGKVKMNDLARQCQQHNDYGFGYTQTLGELGAIWPMGHEGLDTT